MTCAEIKTLPKEFDFKSAVNWGSEVFLADAGEFCYFVDIRSARMSRVRPLPHIVQQSSGWYVDDKVDYDKWLDAIAEQNPYEINGVSERVKNKQQLWEYKLLDLTLRNNLINMRSGRNIVPLPERSIDDILALLRAEKLQEIVEEKSDFSTLKDLARIARNSIEETGANSLFLSLGTLRWFEADSAKPYFAPIMFVPIEIVRRVARKYIVRSRDDESIVNITLLEMLRQTFDLEVPSLHPLPLDEKDQVDYRQVFAKMQAIVDDINENQPSDRRWAIIEESMMGIFSFSKFVMWNDSVTTNPRTFTVTQDTTFTAYFAPLEEYSVEGYVDDLKHGTVQGSGMYYEQSQVSISAQANEGYHFQHWNDSITTNPRTIVLTQDTAFTAYFGVGNVSTVGINAAEANAAGVGGREFIDGVLEGIHADAGTCLVVKLILGNPGSLCRTDDRLLKRIEIHTAFLLICRQR